jgi:hypothetical protein
MKAVDPNTSALFDSVDRGDARTIERCEDACVSLEPCETIWVVDEGGRQHIERDVTTSLKPRARHTSPVPQAPICETTSYGPMRVPGVKGTAGLCRERPEAQDARGARRYQGC